MASFTERMIGAAKLNVGIYEEVEADVTATGQAMTVVIVSSLAGGIGTSWRGGVSGLIIGILGALIGWFLWAFITYLIGTKLLPETQTKSNIGELLRTTGFASSPGIIRVAGVIPLLGGIVMVAVSIWMLITMVIAVRQALDYRSTGRAVGVCLLGWLAYLLLFFMLTRFSGAQMQG
jgi:hypothetical protein